MPKDKYQETRQRWKREHTVLIALRFVKGKEDDIIEFFNNNRPVKAKIVGIIREYIKKGMINSY